MRWSHLPAIIVTLLVSFLLVVTLAPKNQTLPYHCCRMRSLFHKDVFYGSFCEAGDRYTMSLSLNCPRGYSNFPLLHSRYLYGKGQSLFPMCRLSSNRLPYAGYTRTSHHGLPFADSASSSTPLCIYMLVCSSNLPAFQLFFLFS
jgi:hypothetical protein